MRTSEIKKRLVSLLLAVSLASCVLLAAASCSSGYDLNIGDENTPSWSSKGGDGSSAEGDRPGESGESGEASDGGDEVSGPVPASEDFSKVVDWDKAVDGMIFETLNGKTFKGYVLLIRDASRVSVGIKEKSFSTASRIYEIVEQYGAVAAINGGEFPDDGYNTGSTPIGLTYSGGECVWDDNRSRTFLGFTADNTLVVEEGTSHARADSLGIRDAVSFQNGNTLISNDGGEVRYHYAGEDENTGVSQRTAIGQLADGTVIFLVTDGRTARSLGATRNEIIDILKEYGAVTAGMLDGGSSALLWYRDWYNKYETDKSLLDTWQKIGLVNIFKAFTNPRAMPSYFIVAPDGSSQSAPAESAEAESAEPENTAVVVPTGYSVAIDGVTLDESFVTARDIPFDGADQLPEGTSGFTYVRYCVALAPSTHTVEVRDPSGAAVEAVYDESAKAYRVDPPCDEALEAELADSVIEAFSAYALMMSADGSWSRVSGYFDPSSDICNDTFQSSQYTWTVYDHESAVISDASATDFIRISEKVFMCRVRMTNTLTRNGEQWFDRLDWTAIFRNVGGKWLICGMINNA